MADDFGLCLVSNTRMAARAVTRRYDAYLRPFGITATQFSLLGGVSEMPAATVSEIAEARGFDRTTLTRNLDKLEVSGLVATRRPDSGNCRMSEVTPKGRALIEAALPSWRRAQAQMRAELSSGTFNDSIKMLKRLAKV
jgi:DNA-binding MarR family transcriptional regulator